MSKENEGLRLTEVNDALRLEITGNAEDGPEEYDRYVLKAKEVLKAHPGKRLQTFVNVKHTAELEFFLERGFYVYADMLILEKELSGEDKPVKSGKNPVIEILNVQRDGLKEYLAANKKGFDGVQDPEEQIVYQIGQPGGRIYVSRLGGRIVSSVTVWEINEETIATENIFTVPRCREMGLCEELLTHVLSEMTGKGYKKARLSVYGDDRPALALYLKKGYHVTDTNHELRY